MNDCYKLFFVTSLIVLMSLNVALAQQVTISGKVTADDTGESLPGVSILEKGTTNGGISDIDGRYTISVNKGAILVYSFVGYMSVEMAAGDRSVIDVSLPVDLQQLEEIVVIGYGQVQKRDLTGAVTAVTAKEFNKGAMVSPQDLLVGRVAGLQISSSGGAPGAGARIRIRGGSSINASNEPLIVIDGVPLANDQLAGMRNPMSVVNPNDIASISVLKDASATAIYGARASNGVIIITTKRGTTDKLSFSYNGNVSINTVTGKIDVLDGNEMRALLQERLEANPTNANAQLAVDIAGDANTDWQSEIFDTAISTDHNLSIGGALADMPFRASVGYTDQKGILKTSRLQRTSVSLGLDPSFLDNHLKLKLNFKGMFAKNNFPNEGAIGGAVSFDPTQPVREADSPWGGYFYWKDAVDPDLPRSQSPSNPVALINQTNNQAQVNRYIANAMVDYKLHFFPDLTVGANVAMDKSTSDGLEIVSKEATSERSSFSGLGKRNIYTQEKTNELLETTLNYSKKLPGEAGKIDFLAGYSWQHFKRENIDSLNNLEENSIYDVPKRVFATESYIVSFYGRLQYNLKNKYLLTATLRQDGSSRFLEENRWGLFPSVALKWNINEESFLKSSNSVSQLSLRVSYGITGQQEVGADYPALARVSLGDDGSRYLFGNDYVSTIRYEGYDANLKWEETTTVNLGLDYGFLNDRITGSIDYYQRETVDALSSIPVPLGTNFTNFITTNIGNVLNKGIEASISGFLVDNNDFSWNLGVNVTHNINEITKLTAVNDPDYLGILVGGLGGGVGNTIQVRRVGFPVDSYFMYQQVYDDAGKPIENLYVDQNEDGIINDFDRVVTKNPIPNVFFGFSSRVEYKNFDFSFNARANVGNYVYDNVSSQIAQYTNVIPAQGYLNNVGRDIFNTNFNNNRFLSDYYLHDASFFRMDNISLGYKVSKFFSDDLNAYFSFTVQNAFVITKYNGLDPEVQSPKSTVGTDEFVGIDNNIYPRPRTFVLAVNINF